MATGPELEYLENCSATPTAKRSRRRRTSGVVYAFFAATLALQPAGLAQIREWVGDAQGWLFWVTLALLLAAAMATLAALIFLAQSIWSAPSKLGIRHLTRCRKEDRVIP